MSARPSSLPGWQGEGVQHAAETFLQTVPKMPMLSVPKLLRKNLFNGKVLLTLEGTSRQRRPFCKRAEMLMLTPFHV